MFPINNVDSDGFIIFSSNMQQESIEAIFKARLIGYKVPQGKFKGEEEISYIINARSFDEVVFSPILHMQETILLLDPMTDLGRPAVLYHIGKDTDEDLGHFREVSMEYATIQDNYTYDPSMDSYFVAEKW